MKPLIRGGYEKRTAECAEHQRFDYWRDLVCDEFVQLECEPLRSSVFDGSIRGGVGVSNVQFSEVISDPQLVTRSKRQIAKSAEADFLISFQLKEQGVVRQAGREAILKPGSFALYDSTEPYTLEFKEPFHQLVVQMPKEVLSRHLLHPEKFTAIPISGDSGLGSVLTNFVFSLVHEIQHLDQAPEHLSENLVNMIAMAFSSSLMLDHSASQCAANAALKQRVKHYIDNNLHDPKLTNKSIAHAQGISVRYLSKLFQDDEESIHNLIMHKRLSQAHQLLCNPQYNGHSVERIAYSLGFISPSHFSRAFKKHYKISPSELRG